MDERELIINAIKQKKENTAKVDFDFPEPDVIDKWVKRKKRLESFKGKQTEEWTNVDFLRYLDYMLKDFGVIRSKENTRRDSDKINLLHDKLVKHLKVDMNNSILREFLEWWCSIWAPRLSGSEFNLNLLIQDYQIDRFSSRYKKQVEMAPVIVESKQSTFSSDDDSIYSLGGLPLLLMKRGLVVGYRMLKKHNISDDASFSMMQKTIKQFSKKVCDHVIKITLQGSPYFKSDKVDLTKFGLTVPHGVYFKE